jgi:predicted MFS family arabinose efflux permease
VPAYSWYALALFTLIFLLASFDRSLVSVIIEPIRVEFGVSDPQLGFLAGLAFGIPYAVVSLPFGMIIDRVNRRNFLAGSLALWSLLSAFCGLAVSFMQLVILRMAVGFAEAGFPAAQSMITDYFGAKKRPMALGVFMSGGSMAFVLTFALGGWVAQEWGWRAVFFMACPPGLAVALLFLLTVREPRRGATEENAENPSAEQNAPAPPFLETIRYLFTRPAFVHLFIGYALIAASTASFWSWIGSLLIRIHGLEVRDAGAYIAIGGGMFGFVGALLGAAVVGHLGNRGMKPVLVFVTAASIVITPLGIAMALASSLCVTLGFLVLVGIVKSCYAGPTQGVIFSLAKPRMRGVTASLLNIAGTVIGFGVGPLIAGTISYVMGGGDAIRYGLAALFLINLWAGLHFWAARRAIDA